LYEVASEGDFNLLAELADGFLEPLFE
jgi:hypothetical protein